jgi:hypothetical protein
MTQRDQSRKAAREKGFGEFLSALIDYSMAPPHFQAVCPPQEAHEIGNKGVLEQVAQAARNSDRLKTQDPEQLAERIKLAETNLNSLARTSLWEALKHVTRFVVDRELVELRVERLQNIGDQTADRANPFGDLHALIKSRGIVDSLLAGEHEFMRWIEMCSDPEALLSAYEANETFEQNGGTNPA